MSRRKIDSTKALRRDPVFVAASTLKEQLNLFREIDRKTHKRSHSLGDRIIGKQTIYPDAPPNIQISSDLESILRSGKFSDTQIGLSEKQCLPAIKILYHSIHGVCSSRCDHMSKNLGFDSPDIVAFWTSFFTKQQGTTRTFEFIYLTFLLKFEFSTKVQDKNTVGFISAQCIQLILRKMIESPLLNRFKKDVFPIIDNLVKFLDELMVKIYFYFEDNYVIYFIYTSQQS